MALPQQLFGTDPNQINILPRGAHRATGIFMSAVRSFAFVLMLGHVMGFHASAFAGQEFLREAAETNVNQRYVIESVSVAGVQVNEAKIPSGLRQRLGALVGARCDVALLDDLATQIRRELHLQAATEKLSRGSQPDRIRVNFDVVAKERQFEVAVPKFLYHSNQGWTGEVDATTHVQANSFRLGAVSNGDDLTERFTGYSARYENSTLESGRLRLAVGLENFHEQWTQSTRGVITPDSGLDLYRSRRNIAPEATFAVTKDLSLSAGLSLESTESENRLLGSRAANAITAGARWVGRGLDIRYTLRAGMHSLGSDYSYTRHGLTARYEMKSGRHTASEEFRTGTIEGAAPLFERFILGSSSTLRGWNRYAVDPLGGTRMAHNSLTWGYQIGEGTVETFYDSGALWTSGGTPKVRHSVGAGFRQGIFVLTVAFPVVEGRVTPVFMAGMNY